jgi:purine-binding chemotaxis protein CheW
MVVFILDEQRYGLPLSAVARAIRAVEVTPLPKAPDIVLGVVSVAGQVIPVFNIRKRFRLLEREVGLNDQLIIARTSRRAVALLVDSVTGVMNLSRREIVSPEDIVPRTQYIEGVVKLEHGLVLIHDLDKFLSLDEERHLDRALNDHG